MNKKFVILATVFVDVLGMGIIIPTLPFYVESFGVSAFTITLLFCVFAFFSFFSAPLLGSLSDKYGRRPVMIASIFSTAVGWLVFASATHLWLLFLGRTIDGLAAGNFSTAQAIMSDIAKDEKERAKNLGLIGAVFGIAFVVGPAIGGLLSRISPTFPFWLVGGMATLNMLNALFNLPETHTHRKTESKISLNPFMPILRILRDQAILPRFVVWFLFGFAVSVQQSVFALYLGKVFSFGAFASGLFLTGVGVIITLNQGFLLSRFWLKRFKESQLELLMTGVFTVGFALMSTSILGIFIAGLIGVTFGQSVLRVVLTSQIVGTAHERRGEVLGAMTSAMSLAMIIGPFLAGALFVSHVRWPFLISGALSLASLAILMLNQRAKAKEVPIVETPGDQTLI
ncbi:MFS transporter [Candidatus Peregrinibacteria bacterium]|nr:MFS transporter [Candidatus Peregrinibacteria bacterium]